VILFCPLAFSLSGCSDRDPVNAPPVNHAPEITALSILPDSVAPAAPAALHCAATDVDGDSLTYLWSADGGTITGTAPSFTWTAPAASGLYRLRVTISDGQGNTARDSLQASVLGGTLLIQADQGVVFAHLDGTHALSSTYGGAVEVLGSRIFIIQGHSIQELNISGQEVRSFSASDSASGYATVLPDGGFAFCSNAQDDVDFVDAQGHYLLTVPLPNQSPESWQNIDGKVVGNTLYISEDGENNIVAVDLSSHQAGTARSITDGLGWLGGLDYRMGNFYVTRPTALTRCLPTSATETVCEFSAGAATHLAIVAGYAYVTLNFPGEVWRVELATGTAQLFLSGLDYPQDIEYLPAEMPIQPD
jgi:hypothetical protein